MTNAGKYRSTYTSLAGDKYGCRIINDYNGFYDIELNPEVEDTTMVGVQKRFVKE